MSVIIRLQNLPWSANALDIRQFFRGLSIPEGGVHIVGGEMGDAFIAFSTDEDARQAMMHDREAINGVQIRLLLSSRAEMQKVIETARQQSLLALKKASGSISQPKATPPVLVNAQKTVITSTIQPPVITASSFQNIIASATTGAAPSFLAYQQQAGFTLIPESNITNSTGTTTVSSTKNNNDSDDSGSRHSHERRRSDSRERRRSESRSKERSVLRRRHERSTDRSRERDWSNGKRSRHRSRSRERGRTRSRERSRERSKNNRESNRRNSSPYANTSRSMDVDTKSKSNITGWNSANAYQANYNTTETGLNMFNRMSNYEGNFNNSNTSNANKSLENCNKSMDSVSSIVGTSVPVVPTFQNYNTTNKSLSAINNYSLNNLLNAGNSNDSLKGFALQNPYTTALNANPQDTASKTTSSSAIPGIFVEKKSDDVNTQATTIDGVNNLLQEPIAFANVNPYEQMYPNLFAQAAALSSGQKLTGTKQSSMTTPTNSPRAEEIKIKDVDPNEANCVKISNMCSRTTYSDLRKFFGGLFIPHNGIKMLNDKHGLRVGIAYVQFSRQSSVAKALCRSNNILKGKSVIIEAVAEQEFNEAEDSFRPLNQDKAYSHRSNDSDNENNDNSLHNASNNFTAVNVYKKIQLEPFTVLYIEDIPALATEQDIMKMFSSYSLYDILLIASPENRREFVAHVRFSREEDAKSAYEDKAHHQIGYRRVRVRPGSLEEMENAKEKIRLANEQLMKEEQAAEEEETKKKLKNKITEHKTQDENKNQQQTIVSMDLTQEDDENDVIETTDEIKRNDSNNENDEGVKYRNFETRNNDKYGSQGKANKYNKDVDPRWTQTPQSNNIPSLFDVDPLNTTNLLRNQSRTNPFNDPRIRNMSERGTASVSSIDNNNINQGMGGNNFNNFNSNFNNQHQPNSTTMMNNMENNFVILKNCDYNTRINDVAQLLLTANLGLKHIEPLRNERQLSTGEFIVEFRRTNDAEVAVKRFHNIQFRNRNLRVFPITPQEIADRLGKPFLSYIPGGNGIRINKSMTGDNTQRNNFNTSNNLTNNNNRFNNITPQNMNFNNFRGNNPFNDNNGPMNNNSRNNNGGGNGMPEKFTRPGCVLSLENVPYKAQLSDILRFFQGFDLTPDDIIRRFNDDGTPTGDARVAFVSPDEARAAFGSRTRKQIFGRNVYMRII